MLRSIKFFINNKQYEAQEGESILDVALYEGIEIPHLCKHPDLDVKGNCRTCLVEIEGMGIVTSCSSKAEPGMKVKTNTKDVERARKINLELIFSEHIEKCNQCIYENNCTLLKYARDYNLKINKFFDRKKGYPIWQFSDAIQFDSSKCIDCRNCVEVCDKMQTCKFYEVAERGVETMIKPRDVPRASVETRQCFVSTNGSDLLKNDSGVFDCTYCGQCIVHCPVGAISGVPHWQEVEKLLENRGSPVNSDYSGHVAGKILVAQIAPSIRVSIGEEFGLEPGKILTGQLAASIKELGFDYVFDVNLGADFTTYEEARELAHWINSNKPKPMFTSCCPAWVKFVEFFYPEFISHLTTANSPHMCLGPIIKTYFADILRKDPRDIIVVSIMPCTAKKHEIGLESHQLDGLTSDFSQRKLPAVDYVLTTREYAYLLHKHKIDLVNLKPASLDKPFGIYSGAGAIYGASGGVMESALRSADYFFRVLNENSSLKNVVRGENYKLKNKRFSKTSQSRIEFKQVRGQKGIKSAKIKIAGRKLRVAVANGLGNARKILDDLRAGKVKYDYVEVMACPGGCIGGGGQPIPTNSEIRTKRAVALYEIDKNLPIRTAHENPSVLEVYKKYFRGDEELTEKVLHSKFKVKEREGYFEIK